MTLENTGKDNISNQERLKIKFFFHFFYTESKHVLFNPISDYKELYVLKFPSGAYTFEKIDLEKGTIS